MSTSTTQIEETGDYAQLAATLNPIFATRPFVSFLTGNAGLQTSLIDLVSKINNGTETRNDYIDVLKDIGALGVGVVGLTNLAGITAVGLIPLIAVGVSLAVWDYVDGHPELAQEMKDIFNNPANLKEWIDIWDFFNNEYHIRDNVNSFWSAFKNWTAPRRDPLVLDLDGDGIETLAINATSNVVFDYDGDGLKTGTGWIKGDDGFVVLDRNGNGTIDNGGELFGDQTLVNGVKATDGFAALSGEDSNSDGLFDARDSSFTAVRIWQDTNSDGISQTDELHTMSELGITSINLTSTTTNTITNGNVQIAKGTYTKTNGTTGDSGTLGLLDETGVAGNLSRHSVLRHGIQCLRWIPYQVRDDKIVNNQNFKNRRRVA